MASNLPKVLINITLTGSRILGRALKAGFSQAAANVRHRPDQISDESASSENKASTSSRSISNQLKMTRDEAEMILNVPTSWDRNTLMKRYELLFKANSPPVQDENVAKIQNARKEMTYHSHYLQSKVFRARERLEAELPDEVPESESGTNPSAGDSSSASKVPPDDPKV